MIANEVLTEVKTAFPAEPCIVEHVAGTFRKGCKKPFHSKWQANLRILSSLRASSSGHFGGRAEYLRQKRQCKMLIGGDDISNDFITFRCFSVFVYICTRFCFALIGGNLTAQLTGSHRGIGAGNSNSRDVIANSPSFSRPVARVTQRACSQATFCVLYERFDWLGNLCLPLKWYQGECSGWAVHTACFLFPSTYIHRYNTKHKNKNIKISI